MKKYDSYKDSGIEWIGEIPSHWEVKRGDAIFDLRKELITKEDLNGKEVYHYSIPVIQEYGVPAIEEGDSIDSNKYVVDGEEILFSKLNPRKGTITKSTHHNILAVASTEFVILKPKNSYINYLYYILTSNGFKNYISSLVESATKSHQRANPSDIYKAILPIAKPSEQTSIANFLDLKTSEIDVIIADKKRLLELYEEEKTAIINRAVTKGINPDAPMKDSGIEWLGEIPEHWEVKRFDYLFDFSRGLPITKADLRDTGIPCVSYGEIHSKFGFDVDPNRDLLKCVDDKYLVTNDKSLLQSGDFVFADTSEDLEGSGNFTYLNSSVPTFAGYHTIIGKPIIEFERRYVAYYFNTLPFRNQVRSKVSGTKVFSITQAILKFTNIIFPLISEQQEIVDYIDNECARIDYKKERTEKLIELLTEYRTALISEVVTGKIKVIE